MRCLQLARNGLGTTYPNPLVGSVIVHKDKIIGEGWHKKSGGAHAEVEAIRSVSDRSLLPESTLYVNLEPCSHYGKTPPCADLIVETKIPKVVIGTRDPHEIVSGKGIEKLKQSHIEVAENVLAAECRELNKRFFTLHTKKRPYIILKWAETSDGFIAPLSRVDKNPVWISSRHSRQLVHQWRTEEHAILVGMRTICDDNPMLTSRNWSGENPIRIVIDKRGDIPKDSHIFDNQSPTIIFTPSEKLSVPNVEIEKAVPDNFLTDILAGLFRRNINSVIVEGGSSTLNMFIDAGIWDEARIFSSLKRFGSGISAPRIDGRIESRINILDDELTILRRE